MRISFLVTAASSFALAAGLSLLTASFAVTAIEDNTEIAVRRTLDAADHGWAEVSANGLQVILSGVAADEATRFTAISLTGGVVDAARIIDQMQIAPSGGPVAPAFSAEILRNDSGITIIGLLPSQSDKEALVENLQDIARGNSFANLIEYASYPIPRGWEDAIGFSLVALRELPRSKISVAAGQVTVTAIADSREEKDALTARLTRAAPPGLRLSLDIAAPRPVITPFILRFILDEAGGRFDACSAESETSRKRILAAAQDAGLAAPATCVIGMGVPSPNWSTAAVESISALSKIGGGNVTISNADITLVAAEGTEDALFERVVGELETALPEVFALHAVLPVPADDSATNVVPEFTATLSPEGLVQLRGRVNDDNLKTMAESYAQARFGVENVYTAARVVSDMPIDWPVRVLTGIEALSHLKNGYLRVTPDHMEVWGISQREEVSAQVARLLSDKLGEAETFDLEITFRPPPEPEDKAPDPELCEARIAEIQTASKIAFDPGSATVSAASFDTMNAIADLLQDCGPIRMEIQGHTDSQGREEMNQQLSQARAQSVLNELRSRRVRTAALAAVGYGESRPIAPNDTEEGREANRRIEFWLIRPDVAAAQGASSEAASDAETQVSQQDESASEQEAEADITTQDGEAGESPDDGANTTEAETDTVDAPETAPENATQETGNEQD
ncbi:MAG: OmpA family protein [Rhodobacteraceae bacterium]|nr:OmpA family protein [Paracoccaceae bacterium]